MPTRPRVRGIKILVGVRQAEDGETRSEDVRRTKCSDSYSSLLSCIVHDSARFFLRAALELPPRPRSRFPFPGKKTITRPSTIQRYRELWEIGHGAELITRIPIRSGSGQLFEYFVVIISFTSSFSPPCFILLQSYEPLVQSLALRVQTCLHEF